MVWNVWTVSVWVCGVKIISATVRHDATAWQVDAERELQRARAAGSSGSGAHTRKEDERADANASAAADDVALDLQSLTAWYATQSHVRDAARVARAAQRRGIDDDEANEIRLWLSERKRRNTSEPDAKELSDAERDWIERRK